MIPIIHAHTQSDKSTIGYVQMMWETMRSLASHPGALKLSVHCIGPTAMSRLSELPNTKTYHVPDVDPPNSMAGSTAHAACIEDALRFTDDGEIHLLLDSDTVVLARGWDDYIRIALLDRKVGIIGTAVEDVGGHSSGSTPVQMAKRLPTVAWCALSPLHKWQSLQAMPKKDCNIPIKTEEQSKIYNLPIGYEVLRDVAWQIPQYLHDHNISYEAWPQLKPSKTAVVLKSLTDYHEEWHVAGDVPFVAHQRGSLRHPYRGAGTSANFYNAVDAWLATEKLHEPRWVWQQTTDNEDALATMMSDSARERPRIIELENTTGQVRPPPGAGPAAPNRNEPPIAGWLKATLDGKNAWSRYAAVVPGTVDVAFAPDTSTRHLRLEGTVAGACVSLPAAPDRPHSVTVRNLTAGSVTVRASTGSGTCSVPVGACWYVIVDIDGVIHAE